MTDTADEVSAATNTEPVVEASNAREARKSYKSSVIIMPPGDVWEQIQAIRE